MNLKKRKLLSSEVTGLHDLKGFEDFIHKAQEEEEELLRSDKNYSSSSKSKNEATFEHLTFLGHDSDRLRKIKDFVGKKIPFATEHQQLEKILEKQKDETEFLREEIFQRSDEKSSSYRKNLSKIFDQFFYVNPSS